MYPQKSQVFYAIQRGKNIKMPQPYLPLMVNLAGMIPLIFASAILQFPAIVASYFIASETEWVKNLATAVTTFFNATGANSWGYWLLYFIMVVSFTYFYTTVLFEQQNYGENLVKRSGAHIPGVHGADATQKYLSRIQSRITLPGALLLGLVAIMPFILQILIPATANSAGLFLASSSGLLIVVGVVRDTFMNIEAELKLHGYQEKLLISEERSWRHTSSSSVLRALARERRRRSCLNEPGLRTFHPAICFGRTSRTRPNSASLRRRTWDAENWCPTM
jgi:preprotein translocase subunit SecY